MTPDSALAAVSDPLAQGFLQEWARHENASRTACSECHFELADCCDRHRDNHAPGCSHASVSNAALHRPERYYGECRDCVHPDNLPDDLPESLDTLAADYESDYYDTHFSVGEDGIVACEPSFDGYGCPACADDAEDYFRAWSDCPFYDAARPLPDRIYDDPPTLPESLLTVLLGGRDDAH